jgi:hypothetical protein
MVFWILTILSALSSGDPSGYPGAPILSTYCRRLFLVIEHFLPIASGAARGQINNPLFFN